MKLLVFLLALILCDVNSGNNNGEPQCAVEFVIHNAGFEVEGTLQLQNVEIKFERGDLQRGYINATADPSSIQTGISIRDKHLKRSDYFDVSRYPQIALRSKSFIKNGRDNFAGKFDLTIKSITKEITIPFTIIKKNNAIEYKGSFEISRLDFNVGEKSLTLDDKVKITVTAQIK